MRRYDDHSSETERERIVDAARRTGDRAGQRRRNAADLRSRLQAGARRARSRASRCTPCPARRAAIAALTLAGLPTDRFLFLGFLPAKAKARATRSPRSPQSRATLVLYESGPRLGDTLAALAERLGDARSGGRARDQQAARGMRHRHARRAARALADAAPKGEIVIVVGPPAEAGSRDRRRSSMRRSTRRLQRLSPSRAAAEVAERLNVPRKRAYARALERSQMNRQAAEKRGRGAETLACWYLRLQGWRILARRARVPGGEVDIVARRGGTLAFVEVKARATRGGRGVRARRVALRRVGRRRRAPGAALHARRRRRPDRRAVHRAAAAGRLHLADVWQG